MYHSIIFSAVFAIATVALTSATISKVDYNDLGREASSKFLGRYTVELVVICDKEFGDVFNHDRKKILDYLTIFFWDVNSRYKSFPDVDISFQINGLIVINDTSLQPFIEESKDVEGKGLYTEVLGSFGGWVYEQLSNIPKFDFVLLMTNTNMELSGDGLSYFDSTCVVNHDPMLQFIRAVGVLNEAGDFQGVAKAAQLIAYSLAIEHDDVNECGGGFIMDRGAIGKQYLFSECSYQQLKNFLSSEFSSCLSKKSGSPIIDTKFQSPLAPTMTEQCRIRDPTAWIEPWSKLECAYIRCVGSHPTKPGFGLIYHMNPVENTKCGPTDNNRCFRGRCRVLPLFLSTDSMSCMMVSQPFGSGGDAFLGACDYDKLDAIPLEMVIMTRLPGDLSLVTLSVPYLDKNNTVNGEKCLQPKALTGTLEAAPCLEGCKLQQWKTHWDETVTALQNMATGLCASKPKNGQKHVETTLCDPKDSFYQYWGYNA